MKKDLLTEMSSPFRSGETALEYPINPKGRTLMIGKELAAECKAQLAEKAREEAAYKDETITFNIYSWEDAQTLANILIKHGYEVSIGPISLESVRMEKATTVTIFGFHNKKQGE